MVGLETIENDASFTTIDSEMPEAASTFEIALDVRGGIHKVEGPVGGVYTAHTAVDAEVGDEVVTKDAQGNYAVNTITSLAVSNGNISGLNPLNGNSSMNVSYADLAALIDTSAITPALALPEKYQSLTFRVRDKQYFISGKVNLTFLVEVLDNGALGSVRPFDVRNVSGFATRDVLYLLSASTGQTLHTYDVEQIYGNFDVSSSGTTRQLDATGTSISSISGVGGVSGWESANYIYMVFTNHTKVVKALKSAPHILIDTDILQLPFGYKKLVYPNGDSAYIVIEHAKGIYKVDIVGDSVTGTSVLPPSLGFVGEPLLLSDGLVNFYDGNRYRFSDNAFFNIPRSASFGASSGLVCMTPTTIVASHNGAIRARPGIVNPLNYSKLTTLTFDETPVEPLKEIMPVYPLTAYVKGTEIPMVSREFSFKQFSGKFLFRGTLGTPITTINHKVEIGKKGLYLKSSQLNAFI